MTLCGQSLLLVGEELLLPMAALTRSEFMGFGES